MDEYKSVPSFHCVKLFRQGAKLTKRITRYSYDIIELKNLADIFLQDQRLTFDFDCDTMMKNLREGGGIVRTIEISVFI